MQSKKRCFAKRKEISTTSTREEELIIRFLEEERKRRVEKIVETGRINPEDALVVAILDLSRRVGNVKQRVEKIEATMATKSDIKILRWVLGIGLGVLTTVIGALAVFEVFAH